MIFNFKREFSQEKCIEFYFDGWDDWSYMSIKGDGYHSYNDKPSFVYSNGDKFWHKEGKCHRLTGPAKIAEMCGAKSWFIEGKHYKTEKEFEEKLKEYLSLNDKQNDQILL